MSNPLSSVTSHLERYLKEKVDIRAKGTMEAEQHCSNDGRQGTSKMSLLEKGMLYPDGLVVDRLPTVGFNDRIDERKEVWNSIQVLRHLFPLLVCFRLPEPISETNPNDFEIPYNGRSPRGDSPASANTLDENTSAADALRTHALIHQDRYLASYNIDHSGQLVVHTFSPNHDQMPYNLVSYQSSQDIQHLFSTFNPNSLSKSLQEEYYNLLAVICGFHGSWHTINNFNASMKHQEGTTTLYVPGPYIYKLDTWYSDQNHILCTIPTSDLNNLNFD
ncbi:hypothetical protein C8J56DRAFT_1056922 [Mycena floridula]|nr:hypothetical protein C8J56DRAFT_1056922 [Mycena floridula]